MAAIAAANAAAQVPDVLVITRGGGNADDLAAFSTEQVTRAVAASRVPTLVAIGHEVDVSLAELAADQRASTPSNAAELLTPDRGVVLQQLEELRNDLGRGLAQLVTTRKDWLISERRELDRGLQTAYQTAQSRLEIARRLLSAYDPTTALQRGYAIIRETNGEIIKRTMHLQPGQVVELTLSDGTATATIETVRKS